MKGKLLISLICIAVLAIGLASGKGARGGGSRGGSRYSSSRYSSYRSFRSYSSSSWSTSRKSLAAAAGTIFVSRSLRTRYGAGRGWTDDMRVCQNTALYAKYNGSTTTYGWFLCPTDDVKSDDTYCCGDDELEHCCDFWASQGTAVIIGCTITGVIILIAIAVAVVCCMKMSKAKKKQRTAPTNFSGSAVVFSRSDESATVASKADDSPPAYTTVNPNYQTQYSNVYPPQPAPGAQLPYPNSPPPAYPVQGATAAPIPEKTPPTAFSETS